jgi:hypothetical protein
MSCADQRPYLIRGDDAPIADHIPARQRLGVEETSLAGPVLYQ